MNIIYAQEPIRPSIFLAGPSPRCVDVKSWRPEAYEILRELKFNGDVLTPEPRVWSKDPNFNYDNQVNWEWTGLTTATIVVFWIPRSDELPGFTTNVEYGLFASSRKSIMGYPLGSPKMSYLHQLANRFNIPVRHSLHETLAEAMLLVNDAAQIQSSFNSH